VYLHALPDFPTPWFPLPSLCSLIAVVVVGGALEWWCGNGGVTGVWDDPRVVVCETSTRVC